MLYFSLFFFFFQHAHLYLFTFSDQPAAVGSTSVEVVVVPKSRIFERGVKACANQKRTSLKMNVFLCTNSYFGSKPKGALVVAFELLLSIDIENKKSINSTCLFRRLCREKESSV